MASESDELLFFDTFSHDASEEINLDLVQFPKPVILSEIRIIPLGARVQADFPGGGVRLGATNPSQFHIEFFVNDLSKPGASTFESLGGLEYKQNLDIQFECGQRKIPTDGLVLRGWYTTITLALYGVLSKNLDPIPVAAPSLQDPRVTDVTSSSATAEWVQQHSQVPQSNMYIDQQYAYTSDYQDNGQQQQQQPHGYETWPVQTVPPTAPIATTALPHPDHYRQPTTSKVYDQGQWADDSRSEKKSWEHGKDRHSTSPERDWAERKDNKWEDERDDDRDSRSRDKYWGDDRSKQRGRDKDEERRKDWRDDKDRYSRRREDDRYKERKNRDEDVAVEEVERDRTSRDDRSRSLWPDGGSDSRSRSKQYKDTSWEHDRDKSPYSDASSRRRPRSPPSRSPKRPATPSERYWSPEHSKDYVASPGADSRRRVNSSPTARVTDALSVKVDLKVQSPQTPLESPVKSARGNSPGYNNSPEQALDYEQFEPILSDEDMMDEPDSQFADVDFDFPDDMEEVVKQFNPFTFQVKPLECLLDPSLTECEKLRIYFTNEETNREPFVEVKRFEKLINSIDVRREVTEDWVLYLEQIIPLLDKSIAYLTYDNKNVQTLLDWVEVGLDFDKAMLHTQIGFKVRHIKGGVRLLGGLCCDETFLIELVTKKQMQWRLLDMFHQNYMALPIKLLILHSLDTTLSHPIAVEQFVTEKHGELTCYQKVILMLEVKQLSRVKFALTSILNKVHFYELLDNLKQLVNKLVKDVDYTEDDKNNIILCLQQVVEIFNNCVVMMSQPKRFFPVSVQFEINVNNFTYRCLYKYIKHHKLLEILLVLLTNTNTCNNSSIILEVQNLLEMFMSSNEGLCFLSSKHEVVNSLLKLLHQTGSEEYVEDVIPGTSTCLGVQLSCRLQTIQCLDQLLLLKTTSGDDSSQVFDVLHNLFMITFAQFGKSSVAAVLTIDDNLNILLKHLKSANKKSAIKGYIFDLIVLTVRYSDNIGYLKQYVKVLLDLAENDKQSRLFDIILWLKPFENPNFFEDVSHACEVLKKYSNIEGCQNLPGDLVSSLRVIRYLAIPRHETDKQTDDTYVELKYKYVILQLYSLDGISILGTILTKILEYYEQPFSQAINLLNWQGTNLMSFVEPAIQLIKRMLTYVITARNNDFKDLTCVNVLIQTFTLMQAFPTTSESYLTSQKVCRDIVDTLLAYTLPTVEVSNENEALSKTLWTQMVSEVLKYVTTSCFTFMPGFTLLSELLPLPIPVQTNHELNKTDVDELVKSRKLWSLHLHTLTPLLHDLLIVMAGSSYQPLLQLVRKVCVQLSDLSSITALLISRAILDPLLSSLQKPAQQATQQQQQQLWDVPCSSQALRFLSFLASLLTHGSIKSAILSLLTIGTNNVKSDERFLNLVSAFTSILRSPNNSPTHVQCQEYVILVIQCLIDPEVTLVPMTSVMVEEGSTVSQTDIFFSNSLPARDLLGTLLSALLDHVAMCDHSFSTILLSLKTFLMLTEHDYGFFHLKNCVEMKVDCLWNVLIKICNNISKESTESLSVLSTLLELLREMVIVDSNLTNRTINMTTKELSTIVKWDWKDGDKLHPLLHLESLLKEWSTSEDTLVTLCDSIVEIVTLLNEDGDKPSENKEVTEPVLPTPQSLTAQFASRQVYVVVDAEDHRLTSLYWSTPAQCEDIDQEMEQVGCDLVELSRVYLPELHLTHEVERVCMLRVSEEEEDESKKGPSKYHFSGLRTRRPFITPMRGRGAGRAAPQRGDLFRSRPPNTSRPPSLHVDDFVALETCGQQPTGPTGYNKISMRAAKDIIAARVRGRGRAYTPERGRFFGASYPRRESLRGLPAPRGRATWITHPTGDDIQYHSSVSDPQTVRFVSRGPSWTIPDTRVRTRPFPR